MHHCYLMAFANSWHCAGCDYVSLEEGTVELWHWFATLSMRYTYVMGGACIQTLIWKPSQFFFFVAQGYLSDRNVSVKEQSGEKFLRDCKRSLSKSSQNFFQILFKISDSFSKFSRSSTFSEAHIDMEHLFGCHFVLSDVPFTWLVFIKLDKPEAVTNAKNT